VVVWVVLLYFWERSSV